MREKNKDFLPVILGADENAYSCARMFFEKYGVKSHLICARALTATSHSKILKRTVVCDLDSAEVFNKKVPEILASLKKKHHRLLLIPCSDYYAELCAEFSSVLYNFAENPLLQKETLARFCGKAEFSKLAKEFNFPHPETVISVPSKLISTTFPFVFPIILKPENSNSSEYLHMEISGKKKVYVCHSRRDLDLVLQNFIKCGFDKPIVVQPYISGGCDCLFTVNAYCDKNARVRLVGAAQVIFDCSESNSLGNYIALRPIKNRELCDQAADILERLNYRGFANFDIKKSPETGEYFYLELNPRQGRSSYFIRTAGANLMSEMAEDVIFGIPFSGRKYAEYDGIWSNLPKRYVEKSLPPELQKIKNFDFTLDSKHEHSPLRALKLAKRNLTVARENPLVR